MKNLITVIETVCYQLADKEPQSYDYRYCVESRSNQFPFKQIYQLNKGGNYQLCNFVIIDCQMVIIENVAKPIIQNLTEEEKKEKEYKKIYLVCNNQKIAAIPYGQHLRLTLDDNTDINSLYIFSSENVEMQIVLLPKKSIAVI